VRLKTGVLSIAPYFFSQSESRGGGRSFPISGVGAIGKWAFGGLFAVQQLDRTRLIWNSPISEQTAANQYLSGIVARSLGRGFAIGASAYVASIEAQQGIDQLYSGSDRILQDGSASDARVGLTRQWGEGRKFEAILLHNTYDPMCMAGLHPVHRPTRTPVAERSEFNWTYDRWGAHTEYVMPVTEAGISVVGDGEPPVASEDSRLSHQ
jgi:hypothetical protein